jgi:hypothetical protein
MCVDGSLGTILMTSISRHFEPGYLSLPDRAGKEYLGHEQAPQYSCTDRPRHYTDLLGDDGLVGQVKKASLLTK